MKNFLKKNWTLLLVAAYIILPDLFIGPLDDLGLLIAERVLVGYLSKKREQKEKQDKK